MYIEKAKQLCLVDAFAVLDQLLDCHDFRNESLVNGLFPSESIIVKHSIHIST